MERIIEVKINGQFSSKSSKCAGVQGEGNVTSLRITFDQSWQGYGKRIIWRNAKGLNPVAVILDTQSLIDPENSQLGYITYIPPEPLEFAGWCSFTVEGYSEDEGIVAVAFSVMDTLEVRPGGTGSPAEPTASQALQLQYEIDGLLGRVNNALNGALEEASSYAGMAAQSAEDAASQVELAKDVLESCGQVLEENRLSAEESQGYARESLSHAQTSADYAQESQGYAGQSAEYAQQSLGYANESLSCAGQSGSHALISQSWAVGGTGARQGEDTNNAMFWSLQAQAAAGGGVMSFNGRSGTVLPQSGDYTAQMVGADPQGSAQAVQSLLDSHTQNSSNPHGVTAAQAGAVPQSRKVNGKALSSDITLSASDIGAAASAHTHSASKISGGTISTGSLFANAAAQQTLERAQVRNIKAGTVELEAGVSALETGQIYFVYEG